jgi:hypothetical protein
MEFVCFVEATSGRSVSIVHSRTQTMEFVCLFVCFVEATSGCSVSIVHSRTQTMEFVCLFC